MIPCRVILLATDCIVELKNKVGFLLFNLAIGIKHLTQFLNLFCINYHVVKKLFF